MYHSHRFWYACSTYLLLFLFFFFKLSTKYIDSLKSNQWKKNGKHNEFDSIDKSMQDFCCCYCWFETNNQANQSKLKQFEANTDETVTAELQFQTEINRRCESADEVSIGDVNP